MQAADAQLEFTELHRLDTKADVVLKTVESTSLQWVLHWMSLQPKERLTPLTLDRLPRHGMSFPTLRPGSWAMLHALRADEIFRVLYGLKSIFPLFTGGHSMNLDVWRTYMYDVAWVLGQMYQT